MNKTMWKWQGWKGAGHGQGFLEGVQVESLQDRLAPRDFGWDVILWTWERQQRNLQLFYVTQVLDICYGTLGKRMLLQMRTGIWKIMEQSQWNGSLADSNSTNIWTKVWSEKPTRGKEIIDPRKLFPVLHIRDLGCDQRCVDISTHVHTHLSKYMNRKKK